jgi:hypothetical protein
MHFRKPITEHWYARQQYGGQERVRVDVPMLDAADLALAAKRFLEVGQELDQLRGVVGLQLHQKIFAARHVIAMAHLGFRSGVERQVMLAEESEK